MDIPAAGGSEPVSPGRDGWDSRSGRVDQSSSDPVLRCADIRPLAGAPRAVAEWDGANRRARRFLPAGVWALAGTELGGGGRDDATHRRWDESATGQRRANVGTGDGGIRRRALPEQFAGRVPPVSRTRGGGLRPAVPATGDGVHPRKPRQVRTARLVQVSRLVVGARDDHGGDAAGPAGDAGNALADGVGSGAAARSGLLLFGQEGQTSDPGDGTGADLSAALLLVFRGATVPLSHRAVRGVVERVRDCLSMVLAAAEQPGRKRESAG